MAKIVLFTANDFNTTSGGTIRMYGILNALAENGHQVIFISNCTNYVGFHENIVHIYLNHHINQYSKRKFQLLITYLPLSLINIYYRKLLKKLKLVFEPYQQEQVIFFEYLDNTIGYWLERNKVIHGYINDIHGIAPEEFKFQLSQTDTVKERLKLKLKLKTAKRLDKKVFDHAHKIIFPTIAMMNYWAAQIPSIHDKNNIIIPNALQNSSYYNTPNPALIAQKKLELDIKDTDTIILFAGGFKKSSGILLLIKAFKIINKNNSADKLILLGDGPLRNEAQRLVKQLDIDHAVHFTGFTNYNELRSYQELAHLLVCPDEDNIFSHLIVHFKYLDALLANKVVINGNFRSVLEINPNQELSLGFEPSNLEDLIRVMQDALDNYPFYKKKYAHTRAYILKNMTYLQQMKIFETY